MNLPNCAYCDEPIKMGDKAIRITYGVLGCSAHPHLKIVDKKCEDYFHMSCTMAQRVVE